MEQFPTNNPENTNQEPTSADILANMPSFEEARKQSALPEGVRDEQDYRDYLAEQQARATEQAQAEQEKKRRYEQIINAIEAFSSPDDKDCTLNR